MKINLQNIENLIFEDQKVRNLLNDFSLQFEQWKLSKRTNLNHLCKQTLIYVINSLKESHLIKLEEYFGEKIKIEKIDNSLVKNHSCKIWDELEIFNFENFCVSRNEDDLTLTYWK